MDFLKKKVRNHASHVLCFEFIVCTDPGPLQVDMGRDGTRNLGHSDVEMRWVDIAVRDLNQGVCKLGEGNVS